MVPLYPPGSPLLKADRVREAETYNMSQSVPGPHRQHRQHPQPERRVPHRRSRHQHRGGGDPRRRRRPQHAQRRHRERRLRAVLLQLRRQHGDPAQPPAQGRLRCRRGRRHRRAAGDPPGAGARRGARDRSAQDRHHGLLGGRRAVVGRRRCSTPTSTRSTPMPSDPLAGVSSRPDFVGIIYPGPTPFAKNRVAPAIPKDVPPAFIASGASGDRGHAIWAMDYFAAMLQLGVPNIEMHMYGNGRHPGRRAARRQPAERRSDRSRRHPARHVAGPLRRLVPRPRLPAEARRRDEGGEGRRRVRGAAAEAGGAGRSTDGRSTGRHSADGAVAVAVPRDRRNG